jgi:hydrogenase maturation factor
MRGIIDRFEGDFVVVEVDGETRDVARHLFPSDVKPGDVVIMEGTKITVDREKTEKLRKEIEELMSEVWED